MISLRLVTLHADFVLGSDIANNEIATASGCEFSI